MEKALQFIALYNTHLIKAGFAIVFLLLIIYVYRMFFVVSTSGADDSAGTNEALEQKLNQLLENQKKSVSVFGEVEAPVDAGRSGDTDKLKLEIYSLKQQLADSEKKISESAGAAAVADPAESRQQAEQIRSLESRLAEYEIIAEDIAELSQLRTENAKLKAQLSEPAQESAPESSAIASSPTNSDNTASSMEELNRSLALDKAAAEAVAAAASAMAEQSSAAEQQPSAQQAADDIVASLIGQPSQEPVSEQDQKLLDEFEQTIIKKG